MPSDRLQAPRLVARLYRASNEAVRVQLLNCLLQPLGQEVMVRAEELNQITTEQVLELARFAEQVNPDALRQVAQLVSHQPMGMATFTAAALVLLHRSLSLTMRSMETQASSPMKIQSSEKDSQNIKSLM
jgi:hypothetical protein